MKKALYTLLLAAGAASAFAQQNKTTYAGNVMFSSVSGTDQASAPRISVAYNGDLYATAIRSDNNGAFGWELRKSTDGGATWTSLRYNGTEFLTSSFAQVEVYAAGNSSANFKVLVARSWNVVAGDGAHLVMDEYNASGVLQNNIVDENYTTSHGVVEMRIASDDRSPSGNNVPYAVSLIVDKRGPVDDSVVAFVSEDGGATWPHRQNVYNTTDYIDQLTAAYGSSNETPYSRLGVAWTVATTSGSNYGTLMYNFLYGDDATDAGFTQATVPGNSRNPTLAIALDTASSTMRALLLYEQEGSTDIQGTWVPDAYANGTTEAYTPFGLAETNPYLIYNTKTDKFTYVTQVGGNLRMATNAVSSAAAALPYNVAAALDFDDANDPSGPARLGFVPSTGKMVAVWPSANKVYFDAEAFTPTAVNPVSSGDVAVKLYPNPATDQLHISCTAQAATEATFRLTDVTGRTVLAQEVKLAAGLNEVSLKLPALPAASYTATLRGEAVNFSAQLLVR